MRPGLLIGRWHTLHEGHDWLVAQVRARGLRPLMAVRDTPIDADNPVGTDERCAALRARYGDTVDIIVIPDIAGVYYGRAVGYEVEELKPPGDIARFSGREIRAQNQDT